MTNADSIGDAADSDIDVDMLISSTNGEITQTFDKTGNN